ncbi:MAG TPA: AI-2E family transporter [Verrucomicrobia bacterium]|nr:MAG: hypothetical protein A2X46_01070 [Lentisphaerae bacterium GWF2_57_35]HBA83968.1 AI-2E family transporter [Verrucomicrobiota bacterium]
MTQNQTPDSKGHSPGYYLLIATGLYVAITSFSVLAPIIYSFLLIVLISLALNPLVYRLRTVTHKRKTATGLVTLAFILVFVLTGWAFLVPLKSSTDRISERLPEYWERVQKSLIKIENEARLSEEKIKAEVASETAQEKPEARPEQEARPAPENSTLRPSDLSDSVRSGVSQMLQGLAGSVTGLASSAAQILFVFVTVFFGVLFTLFNPNPIVAAFLSIVPEQRHAKALTIMQRISHFVPQWALATLLAMLAVACLVFLLMLLIFDFMDALVLGLIAGVFEAVPYLGPILSFVPAILLAFGEGGLTPLWVLLAYILVQALENNVISPLIMAGQLELHPVAVIFSMLLSVIVFGVLGVLIAAPMVGIVKIVYDELFRQHFLPTATEADLDRLARRALQEKPIARER